MKIPYETRTIVDYSFKLGYLFSTTINDLREIIFQINGKNFEKVLDILEKDFILRYDSIEKYFLKLLSHEGISEEEYEDVKTFCKDKRILIKEIIEEIKSTNSLSQEKIHSMENLLEDMLDN